MGLGLFFLLRLGDLAVADRELPAAVAVLVSGAVLVGAGLFLEASCQTPPDEDEHNGRSRPDPAAGRRVRATRLSYLCGQWSCRYHAVMSSDGATDKPRPARPGRSDDRGWPASRSGCC